MMDFHPLQLLQTGRPTDFQVIRPEERMTMQEAINHPFVTKNGELPPVEIAVNGYAGEQA